MKRKYRIKLITRYGTHDICTLQKHVSVCGLSLWVNVRKGDGGVIYRRWNNGLDHDRPLLGSDEIRRVTYFDLLGNKITGQ